MESRSIFKIVTIRFMLLLITTYLLWIIFYSHKYGEVVFSQVIPESNEIHFLLEESGLYRIHLIADEKLCRSAKDWDSCLFFKNMTNKNCSIKINKKYFYGESICGSTKSIGHVVTMSMLDFFVKPGGENFSMGFSSLDSSEKYRPTLSITMEPPNKFIRLIHPRYFGIELLVYSLYFLYRNILWVVLFLWISIVIFLFLRK